MSGDGRIRVYALKRIDAAYIHQKGFEDARRAKDLLWATKVRARFQQERLMTQFNEARAEKKSDNMWSLMRAAETEVSVIDRSVACSEAKPNSCGST
jgi:hypothetical protein